MAAWFGILGGSEAHLRRSSFKMSGFGVVLEATKECIETRGGFRGTKTALLQLHDNSNNKLNFTRWAERTFLLS